MADAVRSDVVALYVDPRGPYPKLVSDWYDEVRDARAYAGPLPVVAHPPCGPWGNLRHQSRGDGIDCGPRAVEQVRAFGGVLEHPRGSKLWERCALPIPGVERDMFGGFAIEVEQVSWGHVARKKTWLYFVGVDRCHVGATIRYGGTPTHWVSGGRKVRRGKGGGGAVPPGIKVCSAQQRRRTPVAFAEWLLALAATSRVQRSAA